MIKKFTLALVCALGFSAPAFATSIQIENAHAFFEEEENRLEVFMVIANAGTAADTLYAVKSKAAKSSRLNTSSIAEEHMLESEGEEAVQTTAFEIGAGQSVTLDEDGAHIVLEDLNSMVEAGETVTMTLFFENAGPIKVQAIVEQEEGEHQQ